MTEVLATVPARMGGTYQILRLTTSPAATGDRQYAPAASIAGLIQNRSFGNEFDERAGGVIRRDYAEFVCAESLVVSEGDFIQDGATYWAVIAKLTNGAGTNTWRLAIDENLLAAPDRGGLV